MRCAVSEQMQELLALTGRCRVDVESGCDRVKLAAEQP